MVLEQLYTSWTAIQHPNSPPLQLPCFSATPRQQVEIRLPRHYLAGHGLPDHVLTDERTTLRRHASFTKAILLWRTGRRLGTSLKELVPIGSQQLQADCGVWSVLRHRTFLYRRP
jgi:hypothetical protein